MTPHVDILLATYNGEKYIRELIASIFNQTYQNFRLIIRDDGSTDSTLTILSEIAHKFPEKILVLQTPGKLGCNGNFSALLDYSGSDYIMFSDQDDIWLPKKIELTLKKMLELEAETSRETPLLVHTDLKVVDAQLNAIHSSFWQYSKLYPRKGSLLNRLLVQNVVTGCTIMINRSLALLARPIPTDSLQHDWWLALVASAFGKIGMIEEALILYRQHGGNTLGARPYSFLNFLKIKFSTSRARRQEYTRRNFWQANLFLERYKDQLSERMLNIALAYCGLRKSSHLKKYYLVLKHGFYKNGFMRNVVAIFP